MAEDGYEKTSVPPLKAKSRPIKIERLRDRRPEVVDPMVAASRMMGFTPSLGPSAWTMDDVVAPDVADKDSIISLAYMCADAYVESPDLPDWDDVGDTFNRTLDFGWEGDGLRGHVFADETNSTIVIGLKGTSPAVFDGEGTTTNDKVNDNLFFSCCCAQQGQWTWHQVCDCATGTYTCNNTCVRQALRDENRYYQAALELYSNVTAVYPHSNVWLVGHSLGGAVSSLLGLTYGLPAVTFQAVPEALAASRLGLPVPPHTDPDRPQARANTGSFHFGHTADPIYIGTCNGATASCSFAGYAMETACHTGRECVYDVVADKGWRVGVGTHKIRTVIHDVLMKYDTVPECVFTPDCTDCANWKMYESNGTERTTTSSSSSSTTTLSRTRTSTCKTPGWWGCLDETTTASTTTATDPATTTTSSTTCQTPGWFGCKDKTTTAADTTAPPEATSTPDLPPATSSPSQSSSSTTCQTPGRWWGCNDKTTSTAVTSTVSVPSSPITSAPSGPQPTHSSAPQPTPPPGEGEEHCVRRSWFGRCKEWSSIPELPKTSKMPTPPKEPVGGQPRCLRRSWFGFCKEWEGGVEGVLFDEI